LFITGALGLVRDIYLFRPLNHHLILKPVHHLGFSPPAQLLLKPVFLDKVEQLYYLLPKAVILPE
jgi:hypothetical protein